MASVQLSRSEVRAAEFSRFWRRRVLLPDWDTNPNLPLYESRAKDFYISF